MHVLITTPTFPPQSGGVAEVARRQQCFLAERGHLVEVYSSECDQEDYPAIKRFKVRPGRFPSYAAGDRWGIFAPEEKKRYIESIKKSSAQVILAHCWQAWSTDWIFENLDEIKKPVILFTHGTSVNSCSGLLGVLRFLRWREYAWRTIPHVLQRAAGVFVLENYADQDRFFDIFIAKKIGIDVRVVPNGCAPELLSSHAKLHSDDDEKIILCVAQYTPEKNPAAVLDAFVALNDLHAKLVICGSSATPYFSSMRRRVEKLPSNISGRISLEIALPRNSLLDLYKRASVVVSTSITECQPLVLLDAMGAGVPFISTRVGCVDSLPGGMIVNTSHDLRVALAKLLADPMLRSKLGSAGREAAVHKYNWNNSLLALEKNIEEVVAGVI